MAEVDSIDPEPILVALRLSGLLLVHDSARRNVVSLLTGEVVRGSWWRHRDARRIYAVLGAVTDDGDVESTKLVSGKVTLVHRSLWPALLAVGSARTAWQRQGLTTGASRLLEHIDHVGDDIAVGEDAKELERRLLVAARQEHSDRGNHHTRIESWAHWAARRGVRPAADTRESQAILEAAVLGIGGGRGDLPWSPRASRRRP